MIKKMVLYAAVGATGVLVNVGVLTLARIIWPHAITVTYLMAVEASIVSNYLLNAWLTFRQPLALRGLARYNLVMAAGAIIQTGVYRYFIHLGWPYLWADLVAIPCATAFGFGLSLFWVFRQKRAPSAQPAVAAVPSGRPQQSE
jgi:putative flippase GtrA